MKTIKLILKLTLGLEAVVFIYLLFFYDRNCNGVCFEGLSSAILYVLPLFIITLLSLAAMHLFTSGAKQQSVDMARKNKIQSAFFVVIIFTLAYAGLRLLGVGV